MATISPPAAAAVATESRHSGRSIAPGLGMGRAWVIADVLKTIGPPRQLKVNDADSELARLTAALQKTLDELERNAQRIEAEFDAALGGIFRAHGQILHELLTSGAFERELRESVLTAEMAARRVLKRWYQKFEAIDNQAVRQRADDVLDLGRNLVRRLRGEEGSVLDSIPAGSVLVVERLLPSDVVTLPKANVAAVVVEKLGQGSHAALLAREKGIPTITDIPDVMSLVAAEAELLVDGSAGSLVIAPSEDTRAEFEQRLAIWRASLVRCKAACREPAVTLDGRAVSVEANVGIEADVELALDNGADGVGLLRIEQLYFARPVPPTEDELCGDLQRLVAPLGDRPVTVRLLDIGGDKPLPYLGLPLAPNPVLGLRGVRLLLNYPQLVRTQLGAILRTAAEHPLRVLIPMVTLEDDIRRMREAFDGICRERKVAEPPQFGAMVETPAAALDVPALAKHVDFFCIGTNDLAQYTLAAARDDSSVNDYYLDSHESVMRLLKIVIAEAGERPVTLCGELAGREAQVPRLLEMGFRKLSVAPTLIPTTKSLVRRLDSRAAAI